MCGIVGYVNINGLPADEKIVRDMADIIEHRGPDGEGYWTEGSVSLGHRRLAIIDLTEDSKQPMISSSGRFVMVFNGEIYNFKEIRRTLECKGHNFRTQGDSEVLLKAFKHYGADSFIKFNGMFSCVIFDRMTGVITLARDRFGVKPLYYIFENGVFAFASEIKAFKGHSRLNLALNTKGLSEYLTFMNFISDETLIRNVHLFPAGSYAQLDTRYVSANKESAKLLIQKYWDFRFTGNDRNYNPLVDADRWAEEIKDVFQIAVKRQLVSDVGYSSFLSGGVDSGSITAIASKYAKDEAKTLKTFTAYFDYKGASLNELQFDERNDAQLMADVFKTIHNECAIGPQDFERVFRLLCDHLDEPRVGQSYPNFIISELVSQHETVTLSGCGGDELFGGYPWRYFQGLPAKNFDDYIDGYFKYWRRIAASDEELSAILAPIGGIPSDFNGRELFKSIYPDEAQKASSVEDLLNWTLFFEAKTFLNGLLVVEDKVSMAHGLETRVPFLDNDLVDLACRVPIQAKLRNISGILNKDIEKNSDYKGKNVRRDDGKIILRHMMKDLVPKKIYENKKQGFSAPDASWWRNQNYEFITERLFNSNRRIFDFICHKEVRAVVEGHKDGTRRDGRHKIWAFLHLSETIDNFSL